MSWTTKYPATWTQHQGSSTHAPLPTLEASLPVQDESESESEDEPALPVQDESESESESEDEPPVDVPYDRSHYNYIAHDPSPSDDHSVRSNVISPEQDHDSLFKQRKKLLSAGLVTVLPVAAALWYVSRKTKLSAIKRLQQRAGYNTWTMTPAGRKDALEASGLRIPASILYQGLDRTLTWLWDDEHPGDKTVSNMLYDFERSRILKKQLIGRHALQKHAKNTPPKPTMAVLSALRHASHKRILEVFPCVLEILLTDPLTGRSRPWEDVKKMSRFNKGFLGL
jgi:hypothetical protein